MEFLTALKANVASISPSWAFSYGLFKKKQAQLVFSYLTSLAFHWGIEHDRSYQVVSFPEGHPVQIEYVGVPANCRECELAEEFVRVLLRPAAQGTIMQKNFMFPVVKGLDASTIFAELPHLKTRVEANLESKDFSDWDKAFKR